MGSVEESTLSGYSTCAGPAKGHTDKAGLAAICSSTSPECVVDSLRVLPRPKILKIELSF